MERPEETYEILMSIVVEHDIEHDELRRMNERGLLEMLV
jgi:hypothetical protein